MRALFTLSVNNADEHHLSVAQDKRYVTDTRFEELDGIYASCCSMLEKLHQSLSEWRGSTRTGQTVREGSVPYVCAADSQDWERSLPDDVWVEDPKPET